MVSTVNVKILKHCENLLKMSNKIKKVGLLNFIDDIEQVSPMETAIK